MPKGKRTPRKVFYGSLLVGVSLCLVILGFELNRRYPVPVRMQFIDESGQIQQIHVADTWQEWTIYYSSADVGLAYSDRSSVLFQLSAKNFGSRSYVHVRIPVEYRGGLPTLYVASMSSSAKIYVGQASDANLLGEVEPDPVLFAYTNTVGDRFMCEFWICGGDIMNELKNKHLESDSDPTAVRLFYPVFQALYAGKPFLNIQPFLDKLGGQAASFNLWVQVEQNWKLEGFMARILDSKKISFELQVPFNIAQPVTYTAPFTQTVGATQIGGTVYLTVVVPTYTVTRTATTIVGVGTTVTVKGTTYSTATTATLTAKPPFDFLEWLKATFGAYWWVALIAIAIVVLLLLRWLFSGGGKVVVVSAK